MNVLFFLHPGTNSRAQFIDLIKGFEAAGHSTFVWEMAEAMQVLQSQPQNAPAIRAAISRQIAQLIHEKEIGLSVGMWANAISVTENHQFNDRSVSLFERIRCPHLLMWLDSPERAHQESLRPVFQTGFFDSPYLFHFINNRATAREMERAYRFGNVLPRHYGVNPEVFRPYPDEPREYDLVFNANFGDWPNPPEFVARELAKDEPDLMMLRRHVAATQRPARVALVERFPVPLRAPAAILMERLTALQLEQRHRPMIDRVLEVAAEPGEIGLAARVMLEEPELFATVSNQLRQIEVLERAFVFVHLSHHFTCGLFGNVDYSSLGCRVKSLGTVNYEGQSRIYSRGKIGLSVMRWQDEGGYHVKPFEITASGVACVAAHREGTEQLFEEGREIVTFRTLGEARRKIRELLDDPDRLQAVAEAGRARTLQEHTWATWANDLIDRITRKLPATQSQLAAA